MEAIKICISLPAEHLFHGEQSQSSTGRSALLGAAVQARRCGAPMCNLIAQFISTSTWVFMHVSNSRTKPLLCVQYCVTVPHSIMVVLAYGALNATQGTLGLT